MKTDEQAKRSHASVQFEHPARGKHHCSECRNFRAPSSCAKVVRPIARGDWCILFAHK